MATERDYFSEVQNTTLCPFARDARIAWASSWRKEQTDDVNFARIGEDLAAFCSSAQSDKMHGFVMAIDAGPDGLSDIDSVARRFAESIAALDRCDGGGGLDRTAVDQVGWQWEYAGLRLFLNVFAGCYEPWHPKHLPTADMMILFAQPSFSFDLCRANSDQTSVKEFIRKRFATAGRPYDGQLIDRRVDSVHYMSPAHLGDEAVRWFDHYPDPT